ncbi:MAG: DUF6434 domain-containing protein [Collimonas sp.]|uniref:DUF6434 domain-containing protein n=1 Tax=Collimonas sp. TaxID=1963772 RepID=UPI0032675BF1
MTMNVDWHRALISPATVVDVGYKNTQNVRRFLSLQCGPEFKFDREFMAWIRNGTVKNMGDVADEWTRRQRRALNQSD